MKSGQTIDSSFFKGLTDLAAQFEPLGGAELCLVHGGTADRAQQGVRVIPWSGIPELDW